MFTFFAAVAVAALTKGPTFQDRQILEELANILEDEDGTSEDRLVCSSVA